MNSSTGHTEQSFSRRLRMPNPALKMVPMLALTLVLVSACVTEPSDSQGAENSPRLPTDAEVEQYNASVPPEEHIICRMEKPVGTNIPKRVCRYVRDVAETSDFHREQLRRVLR